MAVYVLMSFDSDEHAKGWIEIQRIYINRRRALTPEQIATIQNPTADYDVVAMYKKPTLFCNVLDGKHNTNRRVIGFTKGTKFGWWVCAQCSKPRQMYVKQIIESNPFGFNILPKEILESPLVKPLDPEI